MKESALNCEEMFGTDQESGVGIADTRRLESVSWLKCFFQKVRESFAAPYESDWEKKAGLPWREWAKYGGMDVSSQPVRATPDAPSESDCETKRDLGWCWNLGPL